VIYGLIGKSLSYSFSKLIHEKLGDYEYSLFSLDENQFQNMMSERKFDGINITIPYKKAAMMFCDEVSEIAKEIGAINTIYKKDNLVRANIDNKTDSNLVGTNAENKTDSNLVGTNTDYYGFLYMLNCAGISLKDKKVLILGAGGTSLTVQKCAKDQGAKTISVAYRNHDFSKEHDAQIIVNTTPVGTFPNNGDKIIDLGDFPKCEGVLDVVYNPLLTELLLRAKEYGLPYSDGLPMLVAQATVAAGLFTGKKYESQNEEILKWLHGEIKNVVLIGMPGSGKSTIGKHLAEKLNKTFVDLDEIVATKAGMSIPEIFSSHGEEFFRKLESDVAKEYGKQKNLVIATGGGVILKKENMDALMQNADIFFLNRKLEDLATEGRPLSTDMAALQKMYDKRLPLYEKYSDYTIDCVKNISDNVSKMHSFLI
jgi:shikimate dehydrogenase